MSAPADDFDFVAFDDLEQDKDEFGFVPFDAKPKVPFDLSNPQANVPSEQKPSVVQSIASSVPVQAGLGVAKRATFPLDILKSLSQGASMEALRDIGEDDEMLDPRVAQEAMQKLYQYFPTQEATEKFLEEQTGIDLSPQSTLGKIARGAGEIYGLSPGNLVKSSTKQLAKKSGGAIAGASTAEGMKELGISEPVADVIGLGIGGAATVGKSAPKALEGEAQKMRDTAQKFKLRQFSGMEAEKPPRVAPVVSEATEKGLRKELGETSMKAIEGVIEQKLPIKSMRDKGINLENAYNVAYDAANKTAKSAGKQPVDISNLVNFIKSRINQIKNSAPSLSSQDKVVLKELKKQRDQLTQAAKASPTLYGPKGEPLTPKSPKNVPKKPTQAQLLDQYKNFNKEVKGIYRKVEFTGAENEVRKLYGELNDELIKTIGKANPQLANELKFANKIFSETSKLNQVEGIMSKAFDKGYDPKKLNRILGNKSNRAFLERSLGKGGVQDLIDIATYGQTAEKKVFDYLKNPKTVGEYISKLTPLQMGLLLGTKAVTLPLAIAKSGMNRIQGYLFTRNATRKSYTNLLRAAATGSPVNLVKASKALEKSIEEEFGSEDDFIEMINAEEGERESE